MNNSKLNNSLLKRDNNEKEHSDRHDCRDSGLFNTANAEGMDPAALKNVYDITRNTSGLMSYCVDKGFLKADSIDNAKKMVAYVAAIPGGVDIRDGDKREAMKP